MSILTKISYILVLFSTVFYLFSPIYAPYTMAVGCAGLAISHLRENYMGSNVRLKRIYRWRRLIAIFFLVASYMMFRGGANFIVPLAIAVVNELYTIYVIEHESE